MPELELRDRVVAVTGGHGFLGGYVCKALTDRGADVRSLGSADYDLLDQGEVRRLFDEIRPSIVVHAAAAVGGIGANQANPGRFLYENGLMGLSLIDSARRSGVERFVLISTTCAYPTDAPLPLREDQMWSGPPAGVTGPYGMAKRLLHEACRTYAAQYGFDSAVLVLANLYGPEDHFEGEYTHVIPAMIGRYVEAAEASAPSLTNWGSGRATRDFVHVADAADAVARACAADVDSLPMNVGSGVETSIRDIADAIKRAVGYRGTVEWDAGRPDGQPRRYLDITRARELLGFEPRISLDEGITDTVRWYLAQRPRRARAVPPPPRPQAGSDSTIARTDLPVSPWSP